MKTRLGFLTPTALLLVSGSLGVTQQLVVFRLTEAVAISVAKP
jgi:hypothetical protein